MKKSTLLIIIVFLSFNFIKAQEPIDSKFNLPPGCVLKQKFKFFDLSYKLEGKHTVHNFSESDLLVIKNIPENELDEFKSIDPEYYNYYMKGISFFDSLSNKVKEIYTINELWYIYVFDQELKSKLLTVK
jgi:hypothetical protein